LIGLVYTVVFARIRDAEPAGGGGVEHLPDLLDDGTVRRPKKQCRMYPPRAASWRSLG